MITPCLSTLHHWLESRKHKLSAEKSSATVFTSRSKEAKLDLHLTINNSPIPVKSKVKILVVTFDSLLNFGEHVGSTKTKLQKCNKIYCTPIWASTISNTNWNHLQKQQNTALCTINGSVKISDITDLHNEREMLPVKAHSEMLAGQFLGAVI